MNSAWKQYEADLSEVCIDAVHELALIAEETVGFPSDRFRVARLTGDLPDLTSAQQTAMSALISRREQGEPLQYLLEKADFFGRSFRVRPGVLIPRFDTEILVQEALKRLRPGNRVLDLCAGSGCVGLTVGAECPGVTVTEIEKYPDAFSVLEQNRAAICPSAVLRRGDVLTDPVTGQYEMILSNPPYIPTEDLSLLSAEVHKEPVSALDGGEDGLLFYRVLIRRYVSALTEGGTMLFECGIGQAAAVEELMRAVGLNDTVRVRDYGGVERVVVAKK